MLARAFGRGRLPHRISVPLSVNLHRGRYFSTKDTFVSAHFQFDPNTIKTYLTRKNLKWQNSPGSPQVSIQTCPFCHDTRGKPDNMWKLYVNGVSGTYFCHRCDAKGSWFDFQKKLGDIQPPDAFLSATSKPAAAPEVKTPAPEAWRLPKTTQNLYSEAFAPVLNYLNKERGLTNETLNAYMVGAGTYKFLNHETEKWVDHKCVTLPWLRTKHQQKKLKQPPAPPQTVPTGHSPNHLPNPQPKVEALGVDDVALVRMKFRPIEIKSFRLDPAGGQWSLFGFHLLKPGDEQIILTEGEFDAMSVYQATGIPAVSLPNGAASMPTEIVELLEPFKRIVFWMDDDVKGREGAIKFSNKLGLARCFLIPSISAHMSPKDLREGKPLPKDANDALRQGMDLKKIVSKAEPIPHKEIMTFAELRDQIYLELANPTQIQGVQSNSFPSFNNLLKGHRKGELTIFSGATGIGKTSVLSQLSLDYCQSGVHTLWGSFELQNTTLAKKMLSQYAALNISKDISKFKGFADAFAELPLHFMRFYGTTSIDQVLDAMEYAVYANDVEHVILDNLQFMTGSQYRGFEKFDVLDGAIEKLRKFATMKQVHVTVVIHPRKEADGAALSTSSIFGSAKATQEADNVVIVQKGHNDTRYLEIVKNRYSGDLGRIYYRFDKDTLKYYELTQKEKEAVLQTAKEEKEKAEKQQQWMNTNN